MAQAGKWDCVIDMVCLLPVEAESDLRAFRGRTDQLIFCSTVDVYRRPAAIHPVTESAEHSPSTAFPYAWNKARCEEIFFRAHARGDFAVTSIRPAMTYGEGHPLIHTLGFRTYWIDRIRKVKPIIVQGDGNSFWVACYRDDVALAFAKAIGNPKALGRGYNVVGEDCMTWNRYYREVAAALGAPQPVLVHIPTDLLVRVAPKAAEWVGVNFSYPCIYDNSAARADLEFRQTVGWIEGVQRTAAWIDARGRVESGDAFSPYDRIIDAWAAASVQMRQELRDFDL
jgi:nucleoside-diphosphate-sugar epimerase